MKQLHTKPLKEIDEPSYQLYDKDVMHEIDVLYLPDDKGRKYLLTVIDVYSGLCDARALISVSMKHCAGALEDIYDKSKYLGNPNCIQADSAFDNAEFRSWCDGHNINLKITEPYNHRQNSHVERLNQLIGSYIWRIQEEYELETGEANTEWLSIYPKIIKFLNDERKIRKRKSILINLY